MSEPATVGEIVDRLPAPRQSAQAITPMQMLQIAVEKGADLDMLSKLMDLQERWEQNEARKAFVEALNAFKAQPPKVAKNKHVKFGQTEYDHATLDQVCGVAGAALSEHGLSHRWETVQADGKIRVTCILMHRLGHSERVSLEAAADTSGSKNPIQAIGSTVTYLERYTLLAVTGIAARDQDDDGHDSNRSTSLTADQKDELIALMKETESDTAKFLGWLRVPALDELPVARFSEAKGKLLEKRAQIAKQKDARK